ncbi:hypothetical protein OE88DRAFT_413884 [Heliocybe sulcata]|uniref:Uncharacterized protein n=1 Tax=Heliocybe sulcata TaxID=5364 RepID=A0A5C3MWV2_9AGAM|nr:hypothetical protein OE88DRAFT_413884 [Heliocybe sulcata]
MRLSRRTSYNQTRLTLLGYRSVPYAPDTMRNVPLFSEGTERLKLPRKNKYAGRLRLKLPIRPPELLVIDVALGATWTWPKLVSSRPIPMRTKQYTTYILLGRPDAIGISMASLTTNPRQ